MRPEPASQGRDAPRRWTLGPRLLPAPAGAGLLLAQVPSWTQLQQKRSSRARGWVWGPESPECGASVDTLVSEGSGQVRGAQAGLRLQGNHLSLTAHWG